MTRITHDRWYEWSKNRPYYTLYLDRRDPLFYEAICWLDAMESDCFGFNQAGNDHLTTVEFASREDAMLFRLTFNSYSKPNSG